MALLARSDAAFSGSFLQLYSQHRDWSPEQWRALFADFSQLGLKRLIVQWTEGFIDLLPRIFEEAGAAQMRVELGLTNEPRFWREAPQIFGELRKRNKPLIQSLKPFSSRPEFAGWYISEEIDDVRWQDRKTRKKLAEYLKEVRKRLKNAPVSISAFSNGAMPPAAYARFVSELIRDTRIDRLLFQDSIGARKLSLEALPGYYGELRVALGEKVEPVVEIFEQVKEDPFEARPAPIERIKSQLNLSRAAGFGPPLVFSVPEYRTAELISAFGPSRLSFANPGK